MSDSESEVTPEVESSVWMVEGPDGTGHSVTPGALEPPEDWKGPRDVPGFRPAGSRRYLWLHSENGRRLYSDDGRVYINPTLWAERPSFWKT